MSRVGQREGITSESFQSGVIYPHYHIPQKTMPSPMFVYDMESRGIHPEERSLLEGIWADMRDPILRDIYADWLEEQGRRETSQVVRDGFVPGYGMASLKYTSTSSGSFGYYYR